MVPFFLSSLLHSPSLIHLHSHSASVCWNSCNFKFCSHVLLDSRCYSENHPVSNVAFTVFVQNWKKNQKTNYLFEHFSKRKYENKFFENRYTTRTILFNIRTECIGWMGENYVKSEINNLASTRLSRIVCDDEWCRLCTNGLVCMRNDGVRTATVWYRLLLFVIPLYARRSKFCVRLSHKDE